MNALKKPVFIIILLVLFTISCTCQGLNFLQKDDNNTDSQTSLQNSEENEEEEAEHQTAANIVEQEEVVEQEEEIEEPEEPEEEVVEHQTATDGWQLIDYRTIGVQFEIPSFWSFEEDSDIQTMADAGEVYVYCEWLEEIDGGMEFTAFDISNLSDEDIADFGEDYGDIYELSSWASAMQDEYLYEESNLIELNEHYRLGSVSAVRMDWEDIYDEGDSYRYISVVTINGNWVNIFYMGIDLTQWDENQSIFEQLISSIEISRG